MIGNTRLVVTDGTAENTAHIIVSVKGAHLEEWLPKTPQPVNQVWASSPYVDGKFLVSKSYDNILDTFIVAISTETQDNTIHELRKFFTLLEKAVDYWTDEYNTHKFWLEARGPCETNIRYAYIVDYFIPECNNPYEPPFSTFDPSTIDEIALNIEHTIWSDSLTIGADCLELETDRTAEVYSMLISDVPTLSSDDAYTTDPATISTAAVNLMLGRDAGGNSYETGIRFRSIAIPKGAIAIQAYITFQVSVVGSNNTCNVRIKGQLAAAPASFSTYADFMGRTRTTAQVDWNAISGWGVLGVDQNTPNIADVITEIVNQAGWASGNDLVIFLRDNVSTNNATRGAASLDNVTYVEPILYVVYYDPVSETIQGEVANCTEYTPAVQSLWRNQLLTHAFYYDASAGTYSDNMVDDDPAGEVDLLPPIPANGDFFYAGIARTGPDDADSAQPFYSLIVDITQIAADLTTTAWQAWNGAWTAFTPRYVLDDMFRLGTLSTGLHFLTWGVMDDWVETTVNGITGYWIRLAVTAVGANPVAPQRDPTKAIYTISWPNVEVEVEQLAGDVDTIIDFLLATLIASCQTIMISARRYDRTGSGEFVNYLPCNDTYLTPTSVFTPDITTGGTVSLLRSAIGPTSAVTRWVPVGALSISPITFNLNGNVYSGRYRAFLRIHIDGVTGTEKLEFNLTISSIAGYSLQTPKVYLYAPGTEKYMTIDLGLIAFPAELMEVAVAPSLGARITINATTDAALTYLDFIDLVLMPVDEAHAEITIVNNNPGSLTSFHDGPIQLISTNLKTGPYCFLKTTTYSGHDERLVDWNLEASEKLRADVLGMFALHPNEKYWLIFFSYEDTYPGLDIYSEIIAPAASKDQRYLLMRGDE